MLTTKSNKSLRSTVFGVSFSLVVLFGVIGSIAIYNRTRPDNTASQYNDIPTPNVHDSQIVSNDDSATSGLSLDHMNRSTVFITNQDIKDSSNDNNVGVDFSNLAPTPFVVQEKVLGESIYLEREKYPLRTYGTMTSSLDPMANQWWESDIKLFDAWDITTGSSETLLAIIDTGFALQHEEFIDRWYTNIDEEGATTFENPSLLNCSDRSLSLDQSCNRIDDDFDGIVDNESGSTIYEQVSLLNCTDQLLPLDKKCNLVDDDGNGLVDDWRGWDFINFDRSVLPGETNPLGSDTQHGTAVTSVAAASGDNGVGVAGVNWSTRVLPLQAIDDDGYGNSISVARSIRYAVAQGADVISLSLGGEYEDAFLLQTIREAMKAGVIVVAATGNDGCNCISYPANYPEVIGVGALNQSRQPASFSSYGLNLDILAPGVNIAAASWSKTNATSHYVSGLSGTSFATPIVSGAIASLISLLPTASTTEILALLTESSDSLNLSSNTVRSNKIGHGTLDVLSALSRASTPLQVPLITSFQRISHGSALLASGYNADASITVYQCDYDIATTPVYKLTNSNDVFYTASQTEYVVAIQNGYVSTIVSYMCVLQPHDATLSIRAINLDLELDNVLRKR